MGNLIIKGKGGAGNKLIIQDQAGGAVLTTADSGATIASGVTGGAGLSGSTSLGTVTTGTYNATIGSSATFPTGMIIKSGILDFSRATSHRSTTSSSFVETGVAGSITTLKSSSESRLVFKLYIGMMHVADGGQNSQSTITLRTSSSTSYAVGDDLISSTNSYYNYINGGLHQPRHYEIHYKAGSMFPSNLTSYSAGQTLYWRYFMKTSTGTYYFVHTGSHYSVEYQEIAL